MEPMEWEESPPIVFLAPLSSLSAKQEEKCYEPMDWEESSALFASSLVSKEKPSECEDPKKEEGDCAICLASLSEPADDEVTFPSNRLKEISTTECKHKFHRVCLDKWIREKAWKMGCTPTCPVCRAILKTNVRVIRKDGSLAPQSRIHQLQQLVVTPAMLRRIFSGGASPMTALRMNRSYLYQAVPVAVSTSA